MAKLSFTPHQQEAAEVLGGNLLVSAAAGSGKTAVLTERVIRLLAGDDPVSADRIIVVTFTVAAADEMRRRIGGRLSELLAGDPENDWLQSQALLLPKAKICTIHSLCSSLIRENMQTLGLSGELRIIDETELAVYKKSAAEEVFESFYARREPDFLRLLEFTCVRGDKQLFELALSVYDFIRSFSYPLDFLEKSLGMYQASESLDQSPWAKGVREHVTDALDYCLFLLRGCLADMEGEKTVLEKYGDAFRSDLAQVSGLRDLLKKGRLSQASVQAGGLIKQSLRPVRKYEDPDFLEALKGRRARVWDILDEVRERYLRFSEEDFREDTAALAPVVRELFRIVKEIYARIEEKKQADGVLDYADLEHYTLRLLSERTEEGIRKTETAKTLSETYEQIMVDECQDINEVQDSIFSLLSRDGTNLYMVGDVKQSIYRFRKAMPRLFIEKRTNFSPYDPETHAPDSQETITLETNFRSRREVCGAVNFLFSQIMTRRMGEIDYSAGEALTAGASYTDYPSARPEVHILDYSRDSEEEKTVAEARYIGGLIKRMVREGYQVQDGEGFRRCTYRDFAILLRSHKGRAPVYQNELKLLGVPCFSQNSEGYFDAYEVAVILNLLRIIDNPLLDVPLLSVLLSPMFAFSPDKAAQIRLAGRKEPFYFALRTLAGQGDGQCADFLRFLAGMRQKAAVLPVDRLLQEIYDRTDFIALSYAMGGGEQKDANLRLLLSYGERYEQFGAGGLSGFLRYLDRVMESGQDLSCANTSSARADCVRVMSIHASKGLEFPICIVADCGRRFNKSDRNSRFQLNAELGFSLKITDPPTLRSYSSLPFEAIRLQSEKESVSEEMRVLYVAMTRAKEKLIMVMTVPSARSRLREAAGAARSGGRLSPYEVFSAKGYEGWILPALLCHPDCGELRRAAGREDMPVLPADFPLLGVLADSAGERAPEEGERVFSAQAQPELCRRLREAVNFCYPREPLTHVPAKLTATQIAKQSQGEKISLEARPAFMQRQGLTPAQRGTILHSFMQFADFSAAERDLPGEVSRLVEKKFLTSEEAKALRLDKIRAFLSSPLYGRMKAAAEILREYKFLCFLPAGEIDDTLTGSFAGEKVLIQGIADCLIFEPEGITIVDYKTDYAEEESLLITRYFDQLRIYKDAIGKAFSRPVRQCLLYALHMEREIEIPC